MLNYTNTFFLDAPDVWQFRLQDPASSIMEGILVFNKHILFIIVVIVVLVGWLLFNTILNHPDNDTKVSNFINYF